MLSQTTVARQRAHAGALLLDMTELPGWELRINTAVLDLNDPRTCILGQLHDNFHFALLGFEKRFDRLLTYEDLLRYGFLAGSVTYISQEADDPDQVYVSYPELTWAWRCEIGERLYKPAEPYVERIEVSA